MPRPRSTYTAQFKLQAVKMILEQKLSVAEVARRLGVGENLPRGWKKAFLERGDAAFPGHGNPPLPTTNSAASAPRTPGCGPGGTAKKDPPRTSPPRRAELPVHRTERRPVAGYLGVRGAGGVGKRVLRPGVANRQPDRAVAAGVGRYDSRGPRPGEGPL